MSEFEGGEFQIVGAGDGIVGDFSQVKQGAGIITGERASGAVGTMHAGGEAND